MDDLEQNKIKDPLSPATREERKILLAVSAIGLAIDVLGLVPTKISSLGIDFSPGIHATTKLMISVIIVYFLAAFLIYAWHDYTFGRFSRIIEVSRALTSEKQYPGDVIAAAAMHWGHLYGQAARLRIIFDIFVPSAWALFALVALLTRHVGQ